MSEFNDIPLEEDIDLGHDPSAIDAFELGLPDLREQEGISYPAALLSNVVFMDCVKVLKAQKRASFRSMQVWIELPGNEGFQCIGELQMDSDMLIVLKHLRIGVELYWNEELSEQLDLNDPVTLEKFI